MRLNFDIGNGIVSRFGIDVDSKSYEVIIELQRRGLIKVKCVHCHISYARGLSYFKKRAEMMARYAKELRANIVDIGGNMFGRMDDSLKAQYGEYIPLYEEYAKTIGEVFAREFPDGEVQLITENGTLWIASVMMSVLSAIRKIHLAMCFQTIAITSNTLPFTDVPVLRMILSIVIIPVQLILVIRFLFLMLELMVVMLPMTL